MENGTPATFDPALLDRLLALPPQRITRLQDGARVYWLKRPETHRSARWRLQKGDPAAAFRAERQALIQAAALGLPVPRLLAWGPDYMVIEDAGEVLAPLVMRRDLPIERRRDLCAQAGDALAAVHRAGAAHGRPKLRDLCRGEGGVTLLDLERFRLRAGPRRQALDAAILFHSVLQLTRCGPDSAPLLAATVQAYAAGAGATRLARARRAVQAMRLGAPFLWLALRRYPQAHELRAALMLPRLLSDVPV